MTKPLPASGSPNADGRQSPRALGASSPPGHSEPVGGFRLDLGSDRWTWTDEIYAMHGFAPGEIVPSTALTITHIHPDDRQGAIDLLERARSDGSPFSSVHRVIDAQGHLRVLGVTGQGRRDANGEIVELVGYFVDLSESQRAAVDRDATKHIAAGAAGRASIEQAKGILMAGLHVTDDTAFAILRGRSNDTNIPLRTLAREFVDVARDALDNEPVDPATILSALDAAIMRLAEATGSTADAGETDDEPAGDSTTVRAQERSH